MRVFKRIDRNQRAASMYFTLEAGCRMLYNRGAINKWGQDHFADLAKTDPISEQAENA